MKHNAIEYTLIRSARKSIAIQIKDAAVLVRAPQRASKAAIDRFVQQKQGWIQKHLAGQQQTQQKRESFSINYGDTALLAGREFPIVATEGRPGFDGHCFAIPAGMHSTQIKNLLVQVYRDVAEKLLISRTQHFAVQMNVHPTAVRINAARTRWGSCSGKNSINYSWRLVMASPDIMDYVVVHELAHIREHNHSARFWAIVEQAMPHCQQYRKKLRALQQRIAEEGW